MTTAADEAGWTHRERRINGVRLHWVEAGEGPPVVLLHGFPEFWWDGAGRSGRWRMRDSA